MTNFIFQNLDWMLILAMAFCLSLTVILLNELGKFKGVVSGIQVFILLSLIMGASIGINSFGKPLQIDNKYSLKIDSSKTLSLSEKNPVLEYKETSVSGISVTKIQGSSPASDSKVIASIKCNNLDYTGCVNKVKENLNQITASVFLDKEIQVVKF